MINFLNAGDEASFTAFMDEATKTMSPRQRQVVAWRAKPYGQSSAYATFKAVEQYRLGDTVKIIVTLLLIRRATHREQGVAAVHQG